MHLKTSASSYEFLRHRKRGLNLVAGLWTLVFCAAGSFGLRHHAVAQTVDQMTKPRVVVLTDIEADPDDSQSLVRLLLYANEIELAGLVATTSTWQRTRVAPEAIHRILNAYGKVHSNLVTHAPGFPAAEVLRAVVKQGLPVYGMEGVGEGKDSEGSEWLIRVLEEPDERPVWVSVWGGANTLAQALWKIQHTRGHAEAERLYRKLRIYTISDQDDSGPWIRKTFPGVFFIVSPGNYGRSTWIAITQPHPATESERISSRWLAENIQQGHGPLGAEYPDVAYGMEGDTPAFLGLIPNGLNAPERPDWGGWGGRYELRVPEPTPLSQNIAAPGQENVPVAETRPIWTNAEDAYSPIRPQTYGRAFAADTAVHRGNKLSLLRWRDDFQNDFAARMDWTVKAYAEANHPPVPRLAHTDSLTVRAGEYFKLDASGTTDPDGDSMSYDWFEYPEAGTYPERLGFVSNLYSASVRAPQVEAPQTIHFILRVTDKGTPPLSRYRRVVVTVIPR
jgi:hypothetical protein